MKANEDKPRSVLLANHTKSRMPGIKAALVRAGTLVFMSRNLMDTRDCLQDKHPGVILLKPSSEPVQEHELKLVLERVGPDQKLLLLLTRAVPDLEQIGLFQSRIDDFCMGSSPRQLIARIELAFQRIHREAAWQHQLEIAEEKSATDCKTGLPSDRSIIERLKEEFQRADRHRSVLSIIMMDLDAFKELNDREGHPFADFVLQVFAQDL